MPFSKFNSILKSQYKRTGIFIPDINNECNFILKGQGVTATEVVQDSGRKVLDHDTVDLKFRAYGWKEYLKETEFEIQNTSIALVCKYLLQEPLHRRISNGIVLKAIYRDQPGYFRVVRISTGIYSLEDTLGTEIKGIFDIQEHNIRT